MSENKKFVIEQQKYHGETSIISMRLPKDMLDDIDRIAEETNKSRNEILLLGLEFALDNLEIKQQ